MPTVHYMRPQQGFRPKTNPQAAMAGIGLRGMGTTMPMALANPVPSTPAQVIAAALQSGATPPDTATLCSQWDFYFNPGDWEACAATAERGQIQSVATNADTYYGADSTAAQVAQDAADQQSAQAAQDAANVGSYYGAGQLIYTPGAPNNPLGLPTWFWAAVLFAGAVLLEK